MIRPATPDDAHRIAVIQVESWRATYRGMVPDEYLAKLDTGEREEVWGILAGDPNEPLLAACTRDGEVAGFCHVGRSRDEDAGEDTAEITSVYIHPDLLRKGLGRDLISTATAFATDHGFKYITLWVLRENTTALLFYQAMGFHPDGATKTEERPGFVFNEVRYRMALK